MTYTLTIASGGPNFEYKATGFTNAANGVLSMTARVGDTISLPGSTTHPLYFDAGTTTCIFTAATSTQNYTFTTAGTYYFHCGVHAQTCSASACGSTNCTAMAGSVVVSP
jgi:hypothetical protein